MSQGILPTVEVTRASRADRIPIRHMLELYLHDFSEFDGEDLDEGGLFGYSSLDYYWHEPAHAAFVFRVDGRYAGFALVNDDVVFPDSQRWLAEFFVLRKYRRLGVGCSAARQVFDAMPGRWEVGQRRCNAPAQAFWRSAIHRYTDGDYIERQLQSDEWDGPIQLFSSR